MISDLFPWRQQKGRILKSKWLHVCHGCYGQGCHQPFLRTEKNDTFLHNFSIMFFNILIIRSILAIPISDFGLSSYCNWCWVDIRFQSAILKKSYTKRGFLWTPKTISVVTRIQHGEGSSEFAPLAWIIYDISHERLVCPLI